MDRIPCTFWRPEQPEDTLAGLISTETDGSPVMTLHGDGVSVGAAQEAIRDGGVLHARMHFPNDRWASIGVPPVATIFGPLGFTYNLSEDVTRPLDFEPRRVLLGSLVDDEARFTEGRFGFDVLPVVFRPRTPSPSHEKVPDTDHFKIAMEQPNRQWKAKVGDVEVLATIHWAERWGPSFGLEVRPDCALSVSWAMPRPIESVLESWHRLDNLLTYLTDGRTTPLSVRLYGEGSDGQPYNIDRGLLLIRGAKADAKAVEPWSRRHQSMLHLDELPMEFGDLIRRWWEIETEHASTLALILDEEVGRQPNPELIFIQACQAVEAFHRASASLEQAAHGDETHQQILGSIDDGPLVKDLKRWVKDRLRNEPSLRRRLRDLCKPVQSIPLEIVLGGKRMNAFVDVVVETRNYLTHRHSDHSISVWDDPDGLYVLAQCLRSVIFCHILECLGVPFAEQSDFVQRSDTVEVASRHFTPMLLERMGNPNA